MERCARAPRRVVASATRGEAALAKPNTSKRERERERTRERERERESEQRGEVCSSASAAAGWDTGRWEKR